MNIFKFLVRFFVDNLNEGTATAFDVLTRPVLSISGFKVESVSCFMHLH